jgi:transcriptional regulator with XRE-family HTH domain
VNKLRFETVVFARHPPPIGAACNSNTDSYDLGCRARKKGGQMLIGEVLKEVRQGKKLSQGDIERRTGLIRCYISRVENGHTIPSLQTLEKLAMAMDIPLWHIIRGTDGGPAPAPIVGSQKHEIPLGVKNDIRRIQQIMVRMSEKNRKLLVGVAKRMAR